jgi:micrococcal nuclease
MRIVTAVAIGLVCCGAEAAPSCAGDVEIAKAPIIRVEKNAALILKDGRAATLEGIRLPYGETDRAPQAIMSRAFAELRALAVGNMLDLYAVWPKEDRYDRVRSQIFDRDGNWLQIELLRRGLARVEIAPDRGECSAELYTAESEARKARAGLWALPAYALRTPETVGATIGTFQIVVGRVRAANIKDGRVYLDFGADWRTDFTVTIAPDDKKTFRRMRVDPLNYQGRLIRVRGIVQSYNGPEMEIGSPKQIELLE